MNGETRMPKSDTWPGGIGLQEMISMDSAGSCDSVVSANSGFSDDSLEHLSAEERACLLFLEETIESLDNEDDSGLSNDEPDQLPDTSNLASKLADLSASMNKLNGAQKLPSNELIKENVDINPLQSYLVPTPFAIASSCPGSVPGANQAVPSHRSPLSQPHIPVLSKSADHKQKPAAPHVPSEVNVMMPPPVKPRDFSVRMPEGALPRGPLSYDALVHLRKSASTKKTPLCPKIDHTIDSDRPLPVTVEGLKPGSDRSYSQAAVAKLGPPVVAPKPKMPAKSSVKIQSEATATSDSSYNLTCASDQEIVRLEALQKLGLVKDQQHEDDRVAPLPPPKPPSSLDPTLSRISRGPSRSPSFCQSQVGSEPKSSANFHHDHQPASASHPSKSSGLETARPNNQTNGGHRPEPQHVTAAKPVKSDSAAEPVAQKASQAVGYTAMVVPGMGADRKEALRKLGLLKN